MTAFFERRSVEPDSTGEGDGARRRLSWGIGVRSDRRLLALKWDRVGGSFAHFEPERETENADELQAALAEDTEDGPPTIVAFEATASEVTGRIEEADRLFRAASSGQVLEPNNHAEIETTFASNVVGDRVAWTSVEGRRVSRRPSRRPNGG